jgi:hypothetical protein
MEPTDFGAIRGSQRTEMDEGQTGAVFSAVMPLAYRCQASIPYCLILL